jgi:hypothetical protein
VSVQNFFAPTYVRVVVSLGGVYNNSSASLIYGSLPSSVLLSLHTSSLITTMRGVSACLRQIHHHHHHHHRRRHRPAGGMLLSYKGQVAGVVAAAASSGTSCRFRRHNFSSNRSSSQDDAAAAVASHDGPLPLFLVLKNAQTKETTNTSVVPVPRRPKLLLPPLAALAAAASATTTTTNSAVVSTIQDVLDAVNQHYGDSNKDNGNNFVGGMGESDPGVFFIVPNTEHHGGDDKNNDDPLEHAELVTESILAVKEQRHGVPFGLYTTGIVSILDDDIVMSCLKRLNTLHVSLYAASPPDYSKSTGLWKMPDAQQAFGRACSFLAMVGENRGLKLTLAVGLSKTLSSSSAKAGRDLAMSLGAQEVHFY